jgi:hypothetical protein
LFCEGLVNDATSVVPFNALQNFDLNKIDAAIEIFGELLLFIFVKHLPWSVRKFILNPHL